MNTDDKKLKITHTNLKDLCVIEPNVMKDNRGSFFRIFCKEELKDIANISIEQINHSITAKKGTVRGMHFQNEPYAETKIVKCIKGEVLDVVVDIRIDSPTFLQHYSIHLSEVNNKMILIPKGFAHGFQSLEDDTELLYLHSNVYSSKNEGALNINDPKLNIKWQLDTMNLSQRDQEHKFLKDDFQGITVNEM
jgi:dTDP-4-dehydrorhamnose 3,5-epimerase